MKSLLASPGERELISIRDNGPARGGSTQPLKASRFSLCPTSPPSDGQFFFARTGIDARASEWSFYAFSSRRHKVDPLGLRSSLTPAVRFSASLIRRALVYLETSNCGNLSLFSDRLHDVRGTGLLFTVVDRVNLHMIFIGRDT